MNADDSTNLPLLHLENTINIIKGAVAKCLSVNITIMEEYMPSLMDSDSMVSVMQQMYFNRYFRLQLGPTEVTVIEGHNLFDLKRSRCIKLVKV